MELRQYAGSAVPMHREWKRKMSLLRLLAGLLLLVEIGPLAADPIRPAPGETDHVPAFILELPESVNEVLIADTGNATLHRFANDGEKVSWHDERYMSIGLNGIRKQKAWDKKTPLGTYFITERLDTTRLHDKYGAAAFPLDYPNAWDRYNSRTGSGIWLHGVDRHHPQRPPLDTEGCLALQNDALLQVADTLEPLVTPVIVAPEMKWASTAEIEETRLEFRIAIDQWRQSLSDGDLRAYLALYSDDFRYRDMDKADWSAYRLQTFEARHLQRIEISGLLLLADPAEPELYLSRFTQVLATDDNVIETTKRLYWRRTADRRWQILSEDSG